MASPTTVVELRGSVAYSPGINGQQWPSGEDSWPLDKNLMALVNSMPGAIDYRVWSSNANGWGDNPGAQGQYSYSSQYSTSYDFAGSVTKIWQAHTIKTGFDVRRMYDNNIQLMFGPLSYQGIGTYDQQRQHVGYHAEPLPRRPRLRGFVGRLDARHAG